jgi:hypothetical protein
VEFDGVSTAENEPAVAYDLQGEVCQAFLERIH